MSSPKKPAADRALLAAGTEHYKAPEFARLTEVPGSLRTVVEVLRDFGFSTVAKDPGYALDPARTSLRAALRKAAGTASVVVVYYTGHGADLEGGTYFLVSKNSRPGRLSDTAVAARDLLDLVARHDDHGALTQEQPTVLVILDCCYSGSAGMAMVRDALNSIGNSTTWVIATAGPSQYAVQGQFARALRQALRQPLNGPSQPFISLDSLVQAINNANAGHAEQVAHLFVPATGSTGIPRFFPNPGYAPDLAGRTVAEQHWLSRARGGPEETTTGFYLTGVTGRLAAAEDLAGWVTGPEPDRLAVVTGSPGTGKSALLSLPVLLSQPDRRQDMLSIGPGSLIGRAADLIPAGTPVVAVHARGLSTDQAAGTIAQALGRHAVSATGLLEDLEANPLDGGQVVVIDAVDEAASPYTLLSGLAQPLARHSGLRVVAGARRHVLPAVTGTSLTIDLDTSTYRDPQALTDYVSRLLTAAAEPGLTTAYEEASQDAVAGVAAAIARRASARAGGPESFLLGRLLALSVRDRAESVDLTRPDWQERLPGNVADAFDDDLARLRGKEPLARALLTALAWAKGPGLPWETIWAPVARAIAGLSDGGDAVEVGDGGIRWLLDHAGAYFAEDLGPGQRSVYRLFHDLLATHLRGEPTTEERDADPAAATEWEQRQRGSEAAITRALLATVQASPGGRPDWLTAHPYLATYLAQHAATAGIRALAELTRDADFLAIADPVTLTPLLSPATPELRETARIYRRARPLLGANPSANAAYLAEARQALTGTSTRAETAEVRPSYRTYWATVRQDDSLLTMTGHTDWVNAVAFGTAPDGRLLLATGSADGTARIWDPLTGTPLGTPLTAHSHSVNAVAFGTGADGQLLLATGSADGTARIWDPLTSTPLRDPRTGHTDSVNAVAFGTAPDGQLILATGSADGTARIWDPLTSTPLRDPRTGHTDSVNAVAFGTAPDGQLILATGSADRTARIWDPLTGTPLRDPLFGHISGVSSVAFGTDPDGRLLLATSNDYGAARIWDPLTGTPLGDLLSRRVRSVALGTSPDGQLILATGSNDGTAQIWDPLTSTLLGEPITGHISGVSSVALGTSPDGQLILATGSNDGTAQIWDPLTSTLLGEPITGHISGVSSVAFGTSPDGQLILATGSNDRTIRLWDLARSVCTAVLRRRSSVNAVAMSGSLLGIGDDEGVTVIEVML